MKSLYAGPWAFVLLSLILTSSLLRAQAVGGTERPFHYDLSREVTLSGTVASVLPKSTPGTTMGSHIVLMTPSGQVDANLGKFGLLGKNAVVLVPGQQIEITGVMKTIRNKQVFLTRIVKASGKTYAIRNEHGVPVSPQSRERSSRRANGEGL